MGGGVCHGSCSAEGARARPKGFMLHCCTADRGGEPGSPRIVSSLEDSPGISQRDAVVYPLPSIAPMDTFVPKDIFAQPVLERGRGGMSPLARGWPQTSHSLSSPYGSSIIN